ncbi:Piso0_004008 [Millerozyma farinosa CBS 7064]|uniref:ATP-dependent RNA helicase SUV3, mitochondrial n=1 Tax=Pichia sorbitophila (strain ATCC MYA-4447 / BCRC 22081 / CBS 7064 / NBRC 10061 / NRRL Y-12695) TaxID=559304 RepID=G8YA50_PICSO|nr:Piso0_004008 [Millerozyma farinosa CBS 7064]CCE84464.1 Piso0_004008 [Millerozyma farinosa CBS 7064]
MIRIYSRIATGRCRYGQLRHTTSLSRRLLSSSFLRLSSENDLNRGTKSVRDDSEDIKNFKFGIEKTSSLHQLKDVIKASLDTVYARVKAKELQRPFSDLNHVRDDEVDMLFKSFNTKLMQHLETFAVDSSGSRSVEDIDAADFINPMIINAPQIIHSIQMNRVPESFYSFYGIKDRQDVMAHVLTRLLYKEFVAGSLASFKQEESLIDLSNPAEWFPEARRMKRKLIMHVGPTNSGKTYNSLQKLAKAKSGYYAGPLRLLAREIYERFNAQGIKCNLITGEEVVPSMDEFGKVSEISSGTIEMIPLHKKMDICIIDEIQMIADTRRGEAWTNAVLGVQAREIHMCGEESAVSLISKLAEMTGDEIEIHRYKRLGKLSLMNKPINSLGNLMKGDCVIAFSKRKILELKCEIEKTTNLKVGVIYGALPPEIRSKEAYSFNVGDYDVLVASDAVGMGLNLKIKRIVFFATKKFNGSETIPLTISEVKQIAGRAGRYSEIEGESEGFVTAIYKRDLDYLKKVMNKPISDLKKACVWPTNKVWTYYMSKFPKHTSFYSILSSFEKENDNLVMDNYFLTSLDARYEILKLFLRNDLYKRTTIDDQLRLSLAPINISVASPLVVKTTFSFFENITERKTKNIFDFKFLHTTILKSRPKFTATVDETVQCLQYLEENHKIILMFLWLSQRWPTLFVDKESATEMKTLIEKRISEELLNLRRLTKTSRKPFISTNPKRKTKRELRPRP